MLQGRTFWLRRRQIDRKTDRHTDSRLSTHEEGWRPVAPSLLVGKSVRELVTIADNSSSDQFQIFFFENAIFYSGN